MKFKQWTIEKQQNKEKKTRKTHLSKFRNVLCIYKVKTNKQTNNDVFRETQNRDCAQDSEVQIIQQNYTTVCGRRLT